MKKLITTVLILSTVAGLAQTRLDTLILNEVNTYRISQGLDSLYFAEDVKCVAENQVDYISTLKILLHDQVPDVYGIEEEPDFSKRFSNCGVDTTGKKDIEMEVLSAVFDTSGGVFSYEVAAVKVMNSWLSSPEHLAALSIPSLKHVGIASRLSDQLIVPFVNEDFDVEFIEINNLVYYVALDGRE